MLKKDNSKTLGLFNSSYSKNSNAFSKFIMTQKPKAKVNKPNYYSQYLYRLENGEIDKFNTRDIYYFFRDTAKKYNPTYVDMGEIISMKHIKNALSKGLTARQILNVTAFIFESEQNYLDKRKVGVTIFNSAWMNTLVIDSLDWLNDCYVPKKSSKTKTREWVDKIDTSNCSIGIWED